MDSESIVHRTYEQVHNFLTLMLGPEVVHEQLQATFPSWNHLWHTIRDWLRKESMTSMHKSVHSFASLFPNYPSFASELDHSLTLHSEFWNQVHDNLSIAKQRLSC